MIEVFCVRKDVHALCVRRPVSVVSAQRLRRRRSTMKNNFACDSGEKPRPTLRKFGREAYSLATQRKFCKTTLDRKYGKNKWTVSKWHLRDVSARTSKLWPTTLANICRLANESGSTLATSFVCRMVRSSKDFVAVKESGVPLLICEHSGVDTSTPTGKWLLGQMALNAELEAELTAKRTKIALAEAKARGKKLGTRNPKVKNRSANAQQARAVDTAMALQKIVQVYLDERMGAPSIAYKLNGNPKALAINGKPFTRITTHRMIQRMR